ncbi:MAG: NAD(+) synthase [Planctomycetota bacterium]
MLHDDNRPFFSLYSHGMVRVAVGVPECRVADPAFNAQQTVALLERASAQHALLVVFPELGLTAYTCDDLFHQTALQEAALAALQTVRDATRGLMTVAVVGVPLRIDDALYNMAAVLHDGRIVALVPKRYLPEYREYYEVRQFATANHLRRTTLDLLGQHDIPVGEGLIIDVCNGADSRSLMKLAVEICEDMWVPLPPTTFTALAGANVLCNLSASNITIGKADFRHALVRGHSARCVSAYLYAAAGGGESTTDMAWDGQAVIYENGTLLGQSERFAQHATLLASDVDVERLEAERARMNSFRDCAAEHADRLAECRTVRLDVTLPDLPRLTTTRTERFPYVPSNPALRDVRCFEACHIQVAGLVKRLRSTGLQKLVIGISGGLDSTHALIVAALAFDRLGLPRHNILGVTMPGYATSDRTRNSALKLMAAIGCSAREIDIRPACNQMLRDLDHPASRGEAVYDVTFENVQAGERTSLLFRLANQHNALVLGTGDLSELALGWCTYGVGDHMSHYAINASIPKTLIQHLIRWFAARPDTPQGTRDVLRDILATEISPELIPADEADRAGAGDAQPAQRSEDVIGPYELQDFHLFHTLRMGYRPRKVAFLAWCAWHDASQGEWPDDGPDGPDGESRHAYDIATIRRWLRVFVDRFFRLSQFKRTCIPNAPKVGSGGSLSPRGDWRAPSDASAAVWLADVERVPATEGQA